MQTIEIKENQKEIWNRLIAENNPECFLQTWQWGEFQRSMGRRIWRIGVVEDNRIFQDGLGSLKTQIPIPNCKTQTNSKLQNSNSKTDMIAVALLVKHDLPFGMSHLYCPRGPIMKIQNPKSKYQKILETLYGKIEEIAKAEKSLFLKIDPPIELNHESRITNYEFPKEFEKSSIEIQPKNTLVLDLTKSKEDLSKEMKQKTRYNIRLAEKRGVKAFISSNHEKDFSKFWKLIEETSHRNEITSHRKDYYLKMLENLKENEKDGKYNLFSRLYLAEYNGKAIAGNIVLFFGDVSVYLHGASSNEDRVVMAPYLLQWKQILDAKESGCKSYDFWGIAAGGEKESWKGITRFKKGFGGDEKNYIGAYDLAYDKNNYCVYKLIRKARNIINFR